MASRARRSLTRSERGVRDTGTRYRPPGSGKGEPEATVRQPAARSPQPAGPGRTEDCQIGVFAAYASTAGRTLVDREFYPPKSWTNDRDRCQAAEVPDEREFASRNAIAAAIVRRSAAPPGSSRTPASPRPHPRAELVGPAPAPPSQGPPLPLPSSWALLRVAGGAEPLRERHSARYCAPRSAPCGCTGTRLATAWKPPPSYRAPRPVRPSPRCRTHRLRPTVRSARTRRRCPPARCRSRRTGRPSRRPGRPRSR
ncbi:transposase [Streptomyces spongiicola]